MQRPFAFLRLPFFLLFLGLTVSSCWLNPNMQGKGEVYLQGEWQQEQIPVAQQLVSYSLYHLRFDCDSFYVRVNSFSKVNSGSDSCMNTGHWTEYIRGTYEQNHDTLHLKGLFCNADYTLKKEGGCFRSGVYEEFFKVTKKSDSLVQFSSVSSVIPINAHLIKRTTCQVKPL